jgi:NADH pyrophosphatase NudC (nudix superfamily)
VLLAQRKFDKKHDPGRWGPAVAGTVDQGESYESNIYKEAEEEIGLKGVKFDLGPKQLISDGPHKFFCQWFLAKVDAEDFVIQESEVEQVAWFTVDRLKEELKNNSDKFTANSKRWAGLLV